MPKSTSVEDQLGLTVKPRPFPGTSFAIHKSSPTDFDWNETQGKREMRWIEMLTRPLTHGTTIAFLGSGCSKVFGLPDWKGLAEKLAGAAGDKIAGTNAPDLPSLIGHYKRVLGEKRYSRVLERALRPKVAPKPEENPYRALLNLRIRRFVTSNYDDLLEKELEGACKAEKRIFNRATDSFGPRSVAKLCEFVTADPASHHEMVFHCHGRRNLDPLIVTEEDYQGCYFGLGDERMAFRQGLELLYGSNPILFIGTGLNDEDLFRPLRAFGATHQNRRSEQLLFALVPETHQHRIESLYVRYGVKVITYVLGNPKSGAGLAKALKQLHEHWMNYRQSWLRTPPFRDFRRTTSDDVRYHGQQTVPDTRKAALSSTTNRFRRGIRATKSSHPQTYASIGKQPVTSDLDRVTELLKEKNKPVICLLGPGGTGKSWLANQILDNRSSEAGPSNKSFFWSSYYSGDYLSGLDRALACLESDQHITPAALNMISDSIEQKEEIRRDDGPEKEHHRDIRSTGEAESRLSRLERCLQNGSHYLVFDGLERVLRESSAKPDTGIPLNPDIARFFNVITGKHRSKIILTSRLWPETFDSVPHCNAVIGYRLSAATAGEARRVGWLKQISTLKTANLAAIVRLLNGHRYALTLADAWLDVRQKPEVAATELQLLLARTSPEHRVSRMIELVVQDLGTFEQKLLDYLSICMGAIPPVIVANARNWPDRTGIRVSTIHVVP